MHIHSMTELNDTQLESISGGTYFSWLCNHSGGPSGGGGGAVCAPAQPTYHNIYNGPTTIINNNISIINVSNNIINGILAIGVDQSIYN